MLDIDKSILSCLKEAPVEDTLYQFFASPRPAIIYGAGAQANFVLDYCTLSLTDID